MEIWFHFFSEAAKNRFILQNKGITHVLNVAKGNDSLSFDSNPELYKKLGISLLQVEASDNENFPIKSVFNDTSEFIEDALAGGGMVTLCFQAALTCKYYATSGCIWVHLSLSLSVAATHTHMQILWYIWFHLSHSLSLSLFVAAPPHTHLHSDT